MQKYMQHTVTKSKVRHFQHRMKAPNIFLLQLPYSSIPCNDLTHLSQKLRMAQKQTFKLDRKQKTIGIYIQKKALSNLTKLSGAA
jgi:hypothetical protein